MTTNQDILVILKAAQDTRVKEKEEDKEIRAQERKEDMKMILDMIKQGVEKEVKAAIQEVNLRLEEQEKLNQALTTQVNTLVNEMRHLKGAVKDHEAFPALPKPQGLGQQSSKEQQNRGSLVESPFSWTKN